MWNTTWFRLRVVAVLAQRLVRVLCADCKQPYTVDGDELRKKVGMRGRSFDLLPSWRMRACGNTGFLGRVGIFEFMELDEEIRRAIVDRADASTLRTAAREHGMRSLREDGWLKVATGQTTLQEVVRVTQEV